MTIRQTLGILVAPGGVVELRIPNTPKRTVSGYYDNLDKLAADAAVLDRPDMPSIYLTMNPVDPALLARCQNRYKPYAAELTQNHHIIRRHWALLDFDPVRASGISATEEEHSAAMDRAQGCRDWLIEECGAPAASLVLADSGNGSHVLARIDLPND